jgi:hypothetical protein
MRRVPLWHRAFGLLAALALTLPLAAVALREPLHLSTPTARALLDGVMAVLAVVMVAAAYFVLRLPRR